MEDKVMLDKYGNDLDYWYYCPICGRSLLPSFNTCVKHEKVKLVKSLHKKEYYETKLKERKDYISSGFKIVEEEEIIKNPLYNPNESAKNPTPTIVPYIQKEIKNIPKCPTCQSTKIKKISGIKRAAHGYAFGLFSKTARSQFECENCGYKW